MHQRPGEPLLQHHIRTGKTEFHTPSNIPKLSKFHIISHRTYKNVLWTSLEDDFHMNMIEYAPFFGSMLNWRLKGPEFDAFRGFLLASVFEVRQIFLQHASKALIYRPPKVLKR